MELKLSHEIISINESVFDGVLEQPVELDYLLPDYYPSIFKILKCKICPKVYSCRTSGDKLVMDGVAYIKIIYVGEESNQINSIEQKLPFSKTADLKSASEKPIITYSVKTDYVNCRVVNQRRLDIRGAVTIKTKISEQKDEMVISDAEGMGIQLNKTTQTIGSDHLWATNQFKIEEQVDLGSNPPIHKLLYCQAGAISGEHKVVAGKVVTKGEIVMHIMYIPKGEDQPPTTAEFKLPISQIVDVNNITEDYKCCVNFDVTCAEIDLSDNDDDETTLLDVSIDITVCCDCFMNKEIQGINDAFSTMYQAEMVSKKIKTTQLLKFINETVIAKTNIETGDIESVYDIWCDVENINAIQETDCINFTADMTVNIIANASDSMPTIVEKTIPLEFKTESDIKQKDVIISARAFPILVEHSLVGNNVDIKAEIQVQCSVCKEISIDVLTDINIDEEKVKSKNYDSAMTIYYADPGENVWDIAKKYNTSVAEIIKENDLEDNILKQRNMILIPIVN